MLTLSLWLNVLLLKETLLSYKLAGGEAVGVIPLSNKNICPVQIF